MASLVIRGPSRLRGSIGVPSDKSVLHRAFILAALADGRSRLGVADLCGDNRSTLGALAALGVRTDVTADEVLIEGVGMGGLRAPSAPLDAGNSGTTMRLFAGVLAAQPFEATIDGDETLRRRPMGRVVRPLRQMGARLHATEGTGADGPALLPPLTFEGLRTGERLHGIEYTSPVPSAQVKSALLLAGLFADGPTFVREPVLSRDHTERLLLGLRVPVATLGATVGIDPGPWDHRLPALEGNVVGDLSAAAFPIAAALATGSGPVVLTHVGVNPTRTGFLDAIRDMGARFVVVPRGEAGGEPVADLVVEGGVVGRARVGGELLVRLVDEVPALVALAATVDADHEVRDAAELRVKESDRLAALAALLQAFGVPVEELPDGLRFRGGARLRPARVRARGDHRIAMAAAVLALATDGESVVEDAECIATSWPSFVPALRRLGADVSEGGAA